MALLRVVAERESRKLVTLPSVAYVDWTPASPATHRDAIQDRWTSLERDASEEVKIYDTPLAPAACTRINSSASRASTSSPSTTTPSFAVITVAFTL